jgi:threonylcarbamoyladenosine tRNA methylthiotransferase MtaB
MSNPAMKPTAAILTLGCKLNIADSEAMARRLRDAGWEVTGAARGADAVIVNSCSVTHVADRKSRQLASQARRNNPGAIIAFTGCMVETAPKALLGALPVDLVAPQPEQTDVVDRVIAPRPAGAASPPSRSLKTRAFVSVQEGCNDVCAFCIIPRTRGRERSKKIAAVLEEARQREEEGVLELVITGTQLGAYGRDLSPAASPFELLSALLDATSAPRIRMSSLQPQDITPPLVDLWRNDRLCPHLHLALQSGSESTLRRMRRHYSASDYGAAVEALRRAMPDVAITTDVIAGFPGETDAEFEESLSFCREMQFAGMHVFPYSARSGTSAAKMPGAVPEPLKRERVQRLMRLAAEMSETYRARFVGREVEVLWETQPEAGTWEGLTPHYVRVRARSEAGLHNQRTLARTTGLHENGVQAEVLA